MWSKGDFSEMYAVFVYCRFGKNIESYLPYMDGVRKVAKGK